jgi:hypothetical protein
VLFGSYKVGSRTIVDRAVVHSVSSFSYELLGRASCCTKGLLLSFCDAGALEVLTHTMLRLTLVGFSELGGDLVDALLRACSCIAVFDQ